MLPHHTKLTQLGARLGLSTLMALALIGCSTAADDAPFREIVGTKMMMTAVIDPSADVVWDSVKSIITAEGIEEIQPQSQEEWIAVRNAAVIVGEAGNLLMLERRAKDQGDWILWSLDLVDAGKAAMLAAETRDPQALFAAGGEIYEACLGCHEQYWIQGDGNVMPER